HIRDCRVARNANGHSLAGAKLLSVGEPYIHSLIKVFRCTLAIPTARSFNNIPGVCALNTESKHQSGEDDSDCKTAFQLCSRTIHSTHFTTISFQELLSNS